MRSTWSPGIRLEVLADFSIVETGTEHRHQLTAYDRESGVEIRLGSLIAGFCADPNSDATGWLRITVERAEAGAGQIAS
jgi:hypothetical protein